MLESLCMAEECRYLWAWLVDFAACAHTSTRYKEGEMQGEEEQGSGEVRHRRGTFEKQRLLLSSGEDSTRQASFSA